MREFINIVETYLNEAAGVSRIIQHINRGTPFIMISAMRADIQYKENLRRTSLLASKLSASGSLAYIETEGEFQEIGQDSPSIEKSFFVMPRKNINLERFRELGVNLMHAFDQDAILFGDGNNVFLIENNNTEFNIGDAATFNLALIATLPGFSSIKNHKFSFIDHSDDPKSIKYGNNLDSF